MGYFMEVYILRVPRTDDRFKNRNVTISHVEPDGRLVIDAQIPIPDDEIICDSCNASIDTDMINILFIEDYEWGALCEECRQKYHNDKPIITA